MKGIESDLAELEGALRRLEVEYDQFLSGKVRIQPNKTESDVLRLIRVYSSRGIQNPGLRFRYSNIVARYNTFKNVWTRKVREMEEGRVIGRPWKAASAQRAPGTSVSAPQEKRRFVAADLQAEERNMKEIFCSYKDLREKCGGETDRLRLESFTRILSERVERIKESKKCEKVEIRLRRDKDKCRILVRPVRDES
jgi:hypothetical protein